MLQPYQQAIWRIEKGAKRLMARKIMKKKNRETKSRRFYLIEIFNFHLTLSSSKGRAFLTLYRILLYGWRSFKPD